MKWHLVECGFVIFFALTTLGFSVFEHELAHKRVYEYAGYNNNTISIKGLDVMLTNHDTIAPQDREKIYELNVLNDVVGYNTKTWGCGIVMFFAMLLVFLIVRFDK